MKNKLEPGIYEHYKGGQYKVIGIAKHSETLKKMVIYRSLQKDRQMWVRPLAMFLEKIEVNGERIPRFKYIEQ